MANKRTWEALDDLLVVKSGWVRILMILLILTSVVGASTQSPRDSEIEDLLKKLNKQPMKTLQSPDGEIIDCVDIYKQPAFDHPLLKNHTIEMRPSFDPRMDNKSNYSSEYVVPIWRQNISCPEGTIPIRRVRKSVLLRAESLESFGTLHPNPYRTRADRIEMAGAIMESHFPLYYGVAGHFSIWKPRVDIMETTSSSIVLTMHGLNSIHSIHAGWAVIPHVFGDDEPRTFVAWEAREGNRNRGCLNLLCSGFIQTNPNFELGSPLSVSRTGGPLHMIAIKINKGTDNLWWVKFNGLNVGYYHPEIFPNYNVAKILEWRGEILNRMNSGHHTITEMGSGEFPVASLNEDYGRVAHIANMVYADHYNDYYPAHNLQIKMSFPRCYNATLQPQPTVIYGPTLFFGGPGGPSCDQETSG